MSRLLTEQVRAARSRSDTEIASVHITCDLIERVYLWHTRPQRLCMREPLVVVRIYGVTVGVRRHARLLAFHVRLDG
jgi:hypothetical protein